MKRQNLFRAAGLVSALAVCAALAQAQSGSTRPRRVNPVSSAPSDEGSARTTTTTTTPGQPANTSTTASTGAARSDTSRAYSLLQQKQYAAAAAEAKKIAAANPQDSEAWKIAGFAEFSLKQYAEAASDLQRALDLQRAAKQEDANTVDALAQAYVLAEKFGEALPLLVTATTRKGGAPDPALLYYRGVAEYRTGRAQEAERSFNLAVKANPKDAASLYYLGQIAYARGDMDAAIAALNRATVTDARLASAWGLLTTAYLRRA
ncbi:MAG TPA: tetratricopeptide repeat protein, partial [Pyrinomonadaceae bacterium]